MRVGDSRREMRAVTSVPARSGIVTIGNLVRAYIEDYELRQFRTLSTARPRARRVGSFFGLTTPAEQVTTQHIRQHQLHRRAEGAAGASINRQTSALSRMFRLGVELGWLSNAPVFPGRLRESGPRQGFFEHVTADGDARVPQAIDVATAASGWNRAPDDSPARGDL